MYENTFLDLRNTIIIDLVCGQKKAPLGVLSRWAVFIAQRKRPILQHEDSLYDLSAFLAFAF